MLEITCAFCNSELLEYQKDGNGNLRRCYLNRIYAPERYAILQNSKKIVVPKDMPVLKCHNCNVLIGTPMKYTDGRLAFRLKYGTFKKNRIG